MDLLYWSRHFRNMPGEGDLPVVDFMRAVAATGYDGPLSLEIFNDQFRGGSPRSIAVDGQRSLVYLMDQVRRAEPALRHRRAGHARPRSRSPASSSSSSPQRRASAEALAGFFHAMGFSQVSRRHVTKDVTLYPAGRGINLVINTEHEGFAHSSYRQPMARRPMRIGLRVEDAAATVARARALGAEHLRAAPAGRRAADPGDPRRRRRRHLLHRPRADSADVWDIEFEPASTSEPDGRRPRRRSTMSLRP